MSRSRHRRRCKYVIDTSTLCRGIRAFFSGNRARPVGEAGTAAALFGTWQDQDVPTFDWVYSEDILTEYKEVLNELKLRDLSIGQLISVIRKKGHLVTPASTPSVSPHPADNVFYAAAEAAGGAAIVTSNPKHFPETDTVRVLSPEAAVAEL